MSRLQDIVQLAVQQWFPGELITFNDRPWWLEGMEIDIHLPYRRFAIEVQGRQHRFFCPTMHGSVEDFQKLRWRDCRKRKLLNDRGYKIAIFKEGSNLVFGGLPSSMKKNFNLRFPLTPSINQAWNDHRMLLGFNHQNKNIAFKVRKGGKLVPINRASSQWLKSHHISASNGSIIEHHPSLTTSGQRPAGTAPVGFGSRSAALAASCRPRTLQAVRPDRDSGVTSLVNPESTPIEHCNVAGYSVGAPHSCPPAA